MAPFKVPHSGRMTSFPGGNARLVILLENAVDRSLADGIEQIHDWDTDSPKRTGGGDKLCLWGRCADA